MKQGPAWNDGRKWGEACQSAEIHSPQGPQAFQQRQVVEDLDDGIVNGVHKEGEEDGFRRSA